MAAKTITIVFDHEEAAKVFGQWFCDRELDYRDYAEIRETHHRGPVSVLGFEFGAVDTTGVITAKCGRFDPLEPTPGPVCYRCGHPDTLLARGADCFECQKCGCYELLSEADQEIYFRPYGEGV